MRSRSNGGVIGAYALPSQNYANGVFFIHDAAIFNTGVNPIWPLASGFIYSATGGTISTASDNSNYKVHTFTSNTTFTVVDGSGELEILLVGGGGSGGSVATSASSYYQAGGGGGGGGVTLVKTWVNPGTVFTVTVGPGGIHPQSGTTTRYNGGSSYVTSTAGHSYQATGGAGGGYASGASVVVGGSGPNGGGGAAAWTGSTATSGGSTSGSFTYGNIGGNGSSNLNVSGIVGGGGGGAGGPGYNGNYPTTVTLSGNGGPGWLWSRTNSYYGAGGGAGKSYNAGTSGLTNALAGISGPAPGDTLDGRGGFTTSQTAGNSGDDVASNYYYGVGGGGSIGNSVTSNSIYGGNGGPGTVIFCYRYR